MSFALLIALINVLLFYLEQEFSGPFIMDFFHSLFAELYYVIIATVTLSICLSQPESCIIILLA